MNRLISLLSLTAFVLIVSCQKSDVDNEANIVASSAKVFTASFENAYTRTYVDNDLYMYWTADDRLSIFTSTFNSQYRFDGQTGANSGSFSKVQDGQFVSGNSVTTNYGVYPYNAATSLTKEEKIQLILPSNQAYATNSFGLGANTMVAVTNGTSDTFLPFKNVCGYLVVKLYGEGKVTKVIFEGNNGEKIAGAATVTASYGNNPTVAMSDEATTSITLDCGDGVELGKTADTATDFWFVIPPTTFSKGFTIKAVGVGGLQMRKSTAAERTIQRNTVNEMSAIEFIFEETPIIAPEIVDLGLSVKWASFNLGASQPEEYGYYYAWGETSPKTDYSRHTYKWLYDTTYYALTKYCNNTSFGYNGYMDGITVLDAEDDVAQVTLGGLWRMPTKDEWSELMECTSTVTTLNGVNGRLITGPNGNSIFLPASGYYYGTSFSRVGSRGYYWSSSYRENLYATHAGFDQESLYPYYLNGFVRFSGLSVRPVYAPSVNVPVSEIVLSDNDLTFTDLGTTQTLVATVIPSGATNKTVTWTSSNTSVATVTQGGKVTAVGYGNAVIIGTTVDEGFSVTCSVRVLTLPDGPIDLGLSVKWASTNVGATKPEEYGGYYAWGETSTKTDYSLSTYKWCTDSYFTLTKYCSNSAYGFNGFTDEKTMLDLNDDVAHVTLGDNWRMPTYAEFTELTTRCTWTWTNMNGVSGLLVTGANDNSIFLPAARYRIGSDYDGDIDFGAYWSSTLCSDTPSKAKGANFYLGVKWEDYTRTIGLPVRPVYYPDGQIWPDPPSPPIIHVTEISLDNSDLSYTDLGASQNMTATVLPSDATNKSVIWTSSNTNVATVDQDGKVTTVGFGIAIITATTVDRELTATCKVRVLTLPEGLINLGLSSHVKWASFNLGASKPEEYGEYFAWGETSAKTDYSWSTYKWCNDGTYRSLTKYCNNYSFGYNGFTDEKTELDLEDDAAHVILGDNWRMPTSSELYELMTQCNWTGTILNGVEGQLVTGPNGNRIFLPAAGLLNGASSRDAGSIGYYWSSSLNTTDATYFARGLGINFDEPWWYTLDWRAFGQSIRPVSD